MPQYQVLVSETTVNRYLVEANSPRSAAQQAWRGNLNEEDIIKLEGCEINDVALDDDGSGVFITYSDTGEAEDCGELDGEEENDTTTDEEDQKLLAQGL